MYRAIGDFALSWVAFNASFLALDERLQQPDRAAWTRAYLAVSRAQHPRIWQIRTELLEVADDEVFETILSLVMTGLIRQAPRPCGCHPPASPL